MMMCGARARGAGSRRCAAGYLVVLPALWLAACDIPTELPRFESRFVVPIEGARVPVTELLPAAVTSAGDAFRVNVAQATAQRTLGDMCEPCRAAHLTVVPKPAFTYSFTVTAPLPADVSSAVLTSGSVQVRVRHAFGFDPIRPAGRTEDGSLTLVVRSGGRQLGSVVVTDALPSALDVTRTIALAPGDVPGPVEVVATISSPAGSAVLINRDAVFRVDVIPGQLTASEARVTVANRQVSVTPVTVNLSGMDAEMRDRVRSGALIMVMDNPFGVTGSLELRMRVAGTGTDIRRTLQVAAGRSAQRIELTGDEVRSLVGQRVDVSVTGPVSGSAGPVVVRPQLEIVLDPRLELVLEIGS